MNAIVFGQGFLGKRISKEIGCELSGINLLNKPELDKYLDEKNPEIVINCVGKTGRPNIDWCESHKEETLLSNVAAAVSLGATCSQRGIYFVHLGSGCVYQGDKNGEGFSEEDTPNHYDSFYSKTKILSENILKEIPCLQIRLRMPIDDRPGERNFIDKIKNYKKIIDTQNSMTTVPSLIRAMKILIEKRKLGIYNVVNPGLISPAEILQMYKEEIAPGLQFEIISASDLDKMTAAKRSNCMLNTKKLQNEGITLPEIHEAVKSCLKNYKNYLK